MSIPPYQCRFGTYSLAGPHDHSVLADLLRSSSDHGDIRLIIQREPNFFADRNPLGKSAAVIGRSPQGKPIFLCEMREYPVYLAGRPIQAVYLGLLRTAGEYRRHIGVLEHGFLAIRKFARLLGFADEFFTAVSHDNLPLRTVLEAGLPRFPRHVRLGDVQSLLLSVQQGRPAPELPAGYSLDLAVPGDAKELEGLLAASGSGWSYAPAPDAGQFVFLLAGGDEARAVFDILVLRHNGLAVGCVGVWDKREQRQLLVEGYSPGAALTRAWRSLIARDAPALPAPGNRLELVFLPFFNIRHSHAEAGGILLRRAMHYAGTLGGQLCALCLSEQNPLGREMGVKGQSSRIGIYRVVFSGRGAAAEGRFFAPQPDLSLL